MIQRHERDKLRNLVPITVGTADTVIYVDDTVANLNHMVQQQQQQLLQQQVIEQQQQQQLLQEQNIIGEQQRVLQEQTLLNSINTNLSTMNMF